jgi:hypothetical protein
LRLGLVHAHSSDWLSHGLSLVRDVLPNVAQSGGGAACVCAVSPLGHSEVGTPPPSGADQPRGRVEHTVPARSGSTSTCSAAAPASDGGGLATESVDGAQAVPTTHNSRQRLALQLQQTDLGMHEPLHRSGRRPRGWPRPAGTPRCGPADPRPARLPGSGHPGRLLPKTIVGRQGTRAPHGDRPADAQDGTIWARRYRSAASGSWAGR